MAFDGDYSSDDNEALAGFIRRLVTSPEGGVGLGPDQDRRSIGQAMMAPGGANTVPNPDQNAKPAMQAPVPPTSPTANLTINEAGPRNGAAPSIGERMAGLDPNTNKQIAGVTSSIKPVIQAPPPDTRTPELMRQKAEVDKPINPRSPNGQVNPQYRMGIGERLLGVLGNFASGVAGKGPVSYIGPGATNRRYAQDETAREGKLAGLTSEISDQEKLDEMNRKLYDTAVQAEDRTAQAKQREAMADKYKNAIDPNSIRYDENEDKWYGKSYGGDEREVEEPKWAQQLSQKQKVDANTPATNARPFSKINPQTKRQEWFVKSKDGSRDLPYLFKNDEEAMQAGDKAAIGRFYYKNRDKEGGRGTSSSAYEGLSANEKRLVEANAPGMYDRIRDMEKSRSEWVSISGENSQQVKNIDASLQSAHTVLGEAVQKVLDARAPRKTKQPPAPGSSAAKGARPANQNSPAAPNLTPIPDKTYKSPKGKVYNIGDDVPGHGTIKGFGRAPDGSVHAMF